MAPLLQGRGTAEHGGSLATEVTTPEQESRKAAAEGRRRLDRSLVHGVAWTGGLKWLTQIASWASTIVVARLLTPADYGLFGMATVYLGFVELVNEFGLGAAIIRQRDLSEEQIADITGVSYALGLFLTVVSVGMAWPVAMFFKEDQVRLILIVLSVTFMLSTVKSVPRALMSRDLQFRRVAVVDATQVIVGLVATLTLAIMGYRYWSLVWGTIIAQTASSLLAVFWRPQPIRWPGGRFGSIRHAITFGWHVVVSRIAWYAYSNADFAVVGRVLGTVALGAYNFGWTIASIPVNRISAMVGQVTPAIFSAVQDDPAELRRYLVRLTEGLALITFPFSVGLALTAHDAVLVALGPKWEPAIWPLRLLGFYAGFRSITTLFPQVLWATGHSRSAMRFSILAALVLPGLFYIGSRWGTVGVASAWIVGYPIVSIPYFRQVFRIVDMPVRQYLGGLWPALLGTIVMTAAVLAAKFLIPPDWPLALHLGVQVAVGALAYAAVILTLFGERARSLIKLVRSRSA